MSGESYFWKSGAAEALRAQSYRRERSKWTVDLSTPKWVSNNSEQVYQVEDTFIILTSDEVNEYLVTEKDLQSEFCERTTRPSEFRWLAHLTAQAMNRRRSQVRNSFRHLKALIHTTTLSKHKSSRILKSNVMKINGAKRSVLRGFQPDTLYKISIQGDSFVVLTAPRMEIHRLLWTGCTNLELTTVSVSKIDIPHYRNQIFSKIEKHEKVITRDRIRSESGTISRQVSINGGKAVVVENCLESSCVIENLDYRFIENTEESFQVAIRDVSTSGLYCLWTPSITVSLKVPIVKVTEQLPNSLVLEWGLNSNDIPSSGVKEWLVVLVGINGSEGCSSNQKEVSAIPPMTWTMIQNFIDLHSRGTLKSHQFHRDGYSGRLIENPREITYLSNFGIYFQVDMLVSNCTSATFRGTHDIIKSSNLRKLDYTAIVIPREGNRWVKQMVQTSKAISIGEHELEKTEGLMIPQESFMCDDVSEIGTAADATAECDSSPPISEGDEREQSLLGISNSREKQSDLEQQNPCKVLSVVQVAEEQVKIMWAEESSQSENIKTLLQPSTQAELTYRCEMRELSPHDCKSESEISIATGTAPTTQLGSISISEISFITALCSHVFESLKAGQYYSIRMSCYSNRTKVWFPWSSSVRFRTLQTPSLKLQALQLGRMSFKVTYVTQPPAGQIQVNVRSTILTGWDQVDIGYAGSQGTEDSDSTSTYSNSIQLFHQPLKVGHMYELSVRQSIFPGDWGVWSKKLRITYTPVPLRVDVDNDKVEVRWDPKRIIKVRAAFKCSLFISPVGKTKKEMTVSITRDCAKAGKYSTSDLEYGNYKMHLLCVIAFPPSATVSLPEIDINNAVCDVIFVGRYEMLFSRVGEDFFQGYLTIPYSKPKEDNNNGGSDIPIMDVHQVTSYTAIQQKQCVKAIGRIRLSSQEELALRSNHVSEVEVSVQPLFNFVSNKDLSTSRPIINKLNLTTMLGISWNGLQASTEYSIKVRVKIINCEGSLGRKSYWWTKWSSLYVITTQSVIKLQLYSVGYRFIGIMWKRFYKIGSSWESDVATDELSQMHKLPDVDSSKDAESWTATTVQQPPRNTRLPVPTKYSSVDSDDNDQIYELDLAFEQDNNPLLSRMYMITNNYELSYSQVPNPEPDSETVIELGAADFFYIIKKNLFPLSTYKIRVRQGTIRSGCNDWEELIATTMPDLKLTGHAIGEQNIIFTISRFEDEIEIERDCSKVKSIGWHTVNFDPREVSFDESTSYVRILEKGRHEPVAWKSFNDNDRTIHCDLLTPSLEYDVQVISSASSQWRPLARFKTPRIAGLSVSNLTDTEVWLSWKMVKMSLLIKPLLGIGTPLPSDSISYKWWFHRPQKRCSVSELVIQKRLKSPGDNDTSQDSQTIDVSPMMKVKHISGLASDTVYDVHVFGGSYGRRANSEPSTLSFMTLPQVASKVTALGPCFSLLSISRRNRDEATAAVCKKSLEDETNLISLAAKLETERRRRETIKSSGGDTSIVDNTIYRLTETVKTESELRVTSGLFHDLEYEVRVFETELIPEAAFGPQGNVPTGLSGVTVFEDRNAEPSSPSSGELKKCSSRFIVQDLISGASYTVISRARSIWWEADTASPDKSKGYWGAWCDPVIFETIQAASSKLICITEKTCEIELTRPALSSHLQSVQASSGFQLQVNGFAVSPTFSVSPSEAITVRLVSLQPDTTYIVNGRDLMTEDSNSTTAKWGPISRCLIFRTVPSRPTLPILYELQTSTESDRRQLGRNRDNFRPTTISYWWKQETPQEVIDPTTMRTRIEKEEAVAAYGKVAFSEEELIRELDKVSTAKQGAEAITVALPMVVRQRLAEEATGREIKELVSVRESQQDLELRPPEIIQPPVPAQQKLSDANIESTPTRETVIQHRVRRQCKKKMREKSLLSQVNKRKNTSKVKLMQKMQQSEAAEVPEVKKEWDVSETESLKAEQPELADSTPHQPLNQPLRKPKKQLRSPAKIRKAGKFSQKRTLPIGIMSRSGKHRGGRRVKRKTTAGSGTALYEDSDNNDEEHKDLEEQNPVELFPVPFNSPTTQISNESDSVHDDGFYLESRLSPLSLTYPDAVKKMARLINVAWDLNECDPEDMVTSDCDVQVTCPSMLELIAHYESGQPPPGISMGFLKMVIERNQYDSVPSKYETLIECATLPTSNFFRPILVWTSIGSVFGNFARIQVPSSIPVSQLAFRLRTRSVAAVTYFSKYRAAVSDDIRPSPCSTIISWKTPEIPLPPTQVCITSVTYNTVRLKWVVSESLKTHNQLIYTVFITEQDKCDGWIAACKVRNNTAVVGDLVVNTKYKIRVRAESTFGIGQPTTAILFTTALAAERVKYTEKLRKETKHVSSVISSEQLREEVMNMSFRSSNIGIQIPELQLDYIDQPHISLGSISKKFTEPDAVPKSSWHWPYIGRLSDDAVPPIRGTAFHVAEDSIRYRGQVQKQQSLKVPLLSIPTFCEEEVLLQEVVEERVIPNVKDAKPLTSCMSRVSKINYEEKLLKSEAPVPVELEKPETENKKSPLVRNLEVEVHDEQVAVLKDPELNVKQQETASMIAKLEEELGTCTTKPKKVRFTLPKDAHLDIEEREHPKLIESTPHIAVFSLSRSASSSPGLTPSPPLDNSFPDNTPADKLFRALQALEEQPLTSPVSGGDQFKKKHRRLPTPDFEEFRMRTSSIVPNRSKTPPVLNPFQKAPCYIPQRPSSAGGDRKVMSTKLTKNIENTIRKKISIPTEHPRHRVPTPPILNGSGRSTPFSWSGGIKRKDSALSIQNKEGNIGVFELNHNIPDEWHFWVQDGYKDFTSDSLSSVGSICIADEPFRRNGGIPVDWDFDY